MRTPDPSSMDVARLVAVGEPLEVGTAPKPAPGPHEVIVRVEACGLVPNTFNVVNGRTPFILPRLPAVFGLDAAGTIEALGERVLNLRVGQRVYVDPHLTCGTCEGCRREEGCELSCLRGYFAQTERAAQLLDQHAIGALAQYVPAAATAVVPLPEGIDLPTAARFGYLGTSFAGLATAGLGPGRSLLVNGVTGTLGVAAVAIALGLGATRILGVGRDRGRLQQVRDLAPERIETVSSEDDVDLTAWARQRTGGSGVDALYDCLGVGGDAGITDALLEAVRSGGTAALAAGGAEGELTRTYSEAMSRSVAVLGTAWAGRAQFTRMTEMIAAGVIDLSFLRHRRFALDEVNDALAFVGGRPGGFTNVVVEPHRRAV